MQPNFKQYSTEDEVNRGRKRRNGAENKLINFAILDHNGPIHRI